MTKLMALSVFPFSGQDEKCFENGIRLPEVICHMVPYLVLKGLIELRPVVGKMLFFFLRLFNKVLPVLTRGGGGCSIFRAPLDLLKSLIIKIKSLHHREYFLILEDGDIEYGLKDDWIRA